MDGKHTTQTQHIQLSFSIFVCIWRVRCFLLFEGHFAIRTQNSDDDDLLTCWTFQNQLLIVEMIFQWNSRRWDSYLDMMNNDMKLAEDPHIKGDLRYRICLLKILIMLLNTMLARKVYILSNLSMRIAEYQNMAYLFSLLS